MTTIAAIVALPGIVDVGFLGGMALLPMGIRVALHVPLAVTISAGCFMALIGVCWARGWWTPQTRPRDVALAIGLTALAVQLGGWHLVGWGLT